MKVLRQPAVHFVALGALLFAATRAREATRPDASRARIVITAADVERLRAEWTREHGAAPSPPVVTRLVADAVDEEVLHREALARRLGELDPLVHARLARLGAFVAAGAGENPDALAGEARRLGLAEHDVVIRRHLVQVMRLALERLAPGDFPTDAELAARLAADPAPFAQPAHVRFTHVFLARDHHGAGLADATARLRETLVRDGVGPAAAPARGDPFVHGAEVGGAEARLDDLFGPGFAAAVAAAPAGAWSAPIPSSYGLHLVWVQERTPARVPGLETVRSRVLQTLLAARREARLGERLAALRARYEVVVEERS